MKINAPNMAIPMMKPKMLLVAKTRWRKSSIGRIGSAARSSTTTNATASANPPTNKNTEVADHQPKSGPDHPVNSSRQVTAATMVAAPR
jgi:hypothetical protein